MKTNILLLVIAFAPLQTFAGVEEGLLTKIKQNGFKCTENARGDGSYCTNSQNTFVLIPKNLSHYARTVFYAHGFAGVCSPGVSGEGYLKDKMGTLRRLNAVAIFPVRKDSKSFVFNISSAVRGVESALGVGSMPLSIAAHSSGGQLVATHLASAPALAQRVDKILLLDAIYNLERVTNLWINILQTNPKIKIKSVASTTAGKSKILAESLKKTGAFTHVDKPGQHCEMPKYFGDL